ncbi:pyridoxamine 5'-phosphate oxidase family protein [Bianquea renquensis]|jgi:nimC/nimA family protein|uniref:Pyridoxamine 5'-phosphate oxidase family protein n=1 Tax=Bianquea renquensis TaxID=2763661 RepID=A0A926DR45_9FIRM|nr:pyridoxamine 5'-phosphate oxidase family protein [Bianquea renquensis]MBC8542277.1 pyridoxamine 5'-phosphate oxidase family protein [Bianquea renquensis]
MNQAVQFLKETNTFYLATMDLDQPRVRPFGAVMEWNGRIYICTSNEKQVYQQMLANPKIEISATAEDGRWIRIAGAVNRDPSSEAKAAMLDAYPSLQGLYSLDDGKFEVFYLSDATATIYSMTAAPVELTL